MSKKLLSTLLLLISSLLMMACPFRKSGQIVDYNDAERKLRVATNVSELAYDSWSRVYESFGQLKTEGRLSDARWASLQAIDIVIVHTEADLIDRLGKSKNLLEQWHHSSQKLLTAESTQDVVSLRERELDALQRFQGSVTDLMTTSVKLRDSYAEAMLVADKAVKEGLPLPSEHLLVIRQVVKMVEMETKNMPRNKVAKRTEIKETVPSVAVNIK